MLITITELQYEAVLIGEKVMSIEARVDQLITESWTILLNGPTPLEDEEAIIQKVSQAHRVAEEVQQNLYKFLG